jgi:hypothetical protein
MRPIRCKCRFGIRNRRVVSLFSFQLSQRLLPSVGNESLPFRAEHIEWVFAVLGLVVSPPEALRDSFGGQAEPPVDTFLLEQAHSVKDGSDLVPTDAIAGTKFSDRYPIASCYGDKFACAAVKHVFCVLHEMAPKKRKPAKRGSQRATGVLFCGVAGVGNMFRSKQVRT